MQLLTSQQAKSLPIADIRDTLSPVTFMTTPMSHQARCLLWALERSRIAYWLDVGTGKTLLALYTAYLWDCNDVLVICPNSVIQTWIDQIKEHTDFTHTVLHGTADERRRKLAARGNISIINYEGLRVLWGKKKEKKYRPDMEAIDRSRFDAVIVDECHRTKSSRALVSRIAMELSRRARNCIVMTGTPLTKDQKDLWSEMAVMDMGRSLGRNYWNFVRTYFKPAGFDWKLKRGSLEKILEKLKPNTIRYEREECFDLPERTYEQRRTYMTKEQTDLMASVIAQESGDDAAWTTTAALQCGNKLAQISGGFLYGIDHKAKRLKSNPKLDELETLFDELTGKVIIYHHYAEEGRMIEALLRKLKIKFCSARGEITDKDEQIMKFQKDKNVQVLVAHPSCGGEGINLQCASTMVFFSNGYHYALRVQAEGRIYRLGQKNRCLYIDIVADDGTGDGIDFRILRSLKTKDDAATAVLDYIRGKVRL